MNKKNMPLVSVIIPVYNGSNYVCQAIESVIAQTYSNIEILVVDDGSSDNGATRRCVQQYADKVNYYEKVNGGVASALNHGITRMKGEYFAWLSHDDLMEKDKIELQIESIMKCGNDDVISVGNYYLFDEDTNLLQKTEFDKYYPLERIINSTFLLFWCELHFSSILFHRNHFNRIGLFNEELRTSQDNEFLFRLLRNQRLVFVKDYVSRVRLHRESGTSKDIERVSFENCKQYSKMLADMNHDELKSISGSAKKTRDKINSIIKSMGGSVPEYETKEKMNIIIYGAGQYGRRLNYELAANGKKPICFWDADETKAGRLIDGLMCYPPCENLPKDVLIVVSQKYYLPIIKKIGNRFVLKIEIEKKLLMDEWGF